MPISVECPGCQKRLKAKDELAGKRVKCPACGTPITVAAPAVAAPTPAPLPPAPSPEPEQPDDTPVPRKKRRPHRERERERDSEDDYDRDRERDEEEREREPARRGTRDRDNLKGVSPHYRVNLSRWFAVALPHYKSILGATIGYLFLFSFVVGIWWGISVAALGAIAALSSAGAIVAAPFVLLPFVAVLPALALGFHVVCQKQIKGEPWTFGTFFSGFNWMWRLVGRALLLTLVEVVTLVPIVAIKGIGEALDPPHPPALVGFGAALGLGFSLLGFYVLFRLTYFSHFLIIDRNCGVIESLRGSWILSRGHFWSLFAIMLATMLLLNVFALAAAGFAAAFPKAIIVLIPVLVIGVIFQLFAFPAVVLVLNAGYLLVAGKEPLPEEEPNSERVEPRRASILAWLPVPAVTAAVILVGVGMMMLESSRREAFVKEEEKRRERANQLNERMKQEEARRRAEAEQDAKELVAFFREGGYWSVELATFPDEAALPAGPEGPPGAPGPGGMGPAGIGPGAAPPQRPQRILVFGPREMLGKKKTVKLGVAMEPKPEWAGKARKFEELSYPDSMLRKAFYQQFAEAMADGGVEAVLVEVVLQPAHGGPGGPAGIAPPPGAAGPGGMGSAPGEGAAPESQWHGTSVPLGEAKPLSREKFLKLIAEQSGTSVSP